MDISELLSYAVSRGASDLHISSGVAPLVRVDGDLQTVEGTTSMSDESIKSMLSNILPDEYKTILPNKLDIDLGLELDKLPSRFRVNIFHQRRGISAVFRNLPLKIPTLAELGLPEVFYKLSEAQNGLILVTGPTGSGKTTTVAAIIDHINNLYPSHIVTIEDPIEYVHQCKQCLVQQREVMRHTYDFNDALRSALREDPNYILVGEMRDLETIRLALTAAETGHLVFASLHTNSAADSIDRIVGVFPSGEKELIRAMVANSLQAVVAQRLLKKVGGGRVAAAEVLLCNAAVRNLIRENKIAQIYSVIQTSKQLGMQTLSQSIQDLITQGIVVSDSRSLR